MARPSFPSASGRGALLPRGMGGKSRTNARPAGDAAARAVSSSQTYPQGAAYLKLKFFGCAAGPRVHLWRLRDWCGAGARGYGDPLALVRARWKRSKAERPFPASTAAEYGAVRAFPGRGSATTPLYAVALDLPVEARPVDPESPCGLAHVPAGRLQRLADRALLLVLEAGPESAL